MKESDILQLYISFKNDSTLWLGLHHKHFSQFVALVLAIMTATLAVTYKFLGNTPVLYSITVGPIINVVLSIVGIKICDRFYQRFLEHEAISNRFFSLYRSIVESGGSESTGPTLPSGSELFPSRYIDAQGNTESIDTFVKCRKGKGSNLWIHICFGILACLNVIVLVFILFAAAG